MAEDRKPVQKWRRKAQYDKVREENVIYPHFHCDVCEGLIDSQEVYKQIKVEKKDSYPHIQNFCSKACAAKILGDKEDKPIMSLKQKLKKHFLWIILAIYGAIMGLVILILWLMSLG